MKSIHLSRIFHYGHPTIFWEKKISTAEPFSWLKTSKNSFVIRPRRWR
jgi:hypothetical protein